MAAARSGGKAQVGSTRWVLDERAQAGQFIEQEVEEFAFSARNELEWLNEHMSEIFSRNQFDVAEVFKTPGKLRGKTPRTARKHTPGQNRAPLTDIFSSNSPTKNQSPGHTNFYKKVSQFQVAEDKENESHAVHQSPRKDVPHRTHDINTDSGYHEMSDDQENETPRSPVKEAPKLPPRSPNRLVVPIASPSPARPQALQHLQQTQKDLDDSFVSAKEAPVAMPVEESITSKDTITIREDDIDGDDEATMPVQKAVLSDGLHPRKSNQYSVSATTADGLDAALEEVEQNSPARPRKSRSPSEHSSPERPVIRKKSSLTFAFLPAREPLSTKMSMGARASQARGSIRGAPALRDSTFAKPTGNQERQDGEDAADDDTQPDGPMDTDEESSKAAKAPVEPSTLHSKTSTQRLHERITMLGQMKPARPSKSIPSTAITSQSQHTSQTPVSRYQDDELAMDGNDDSWIAPITGRATQSSQTMPGSFSTSSGHWLSQSTLVDSVPETQSLAAKELEAVQAKAPYPKLPAPAADSTTPAGSPVASRWQVDGPLSASKAKFSSFLKSAKGMFASSAAASAQAKMETMSSNPSRSRLDTQTAEPIETENQTEKAALQGLQDRVASATRGSDMNMKQPKRRSSQRVQHQEDKAPKDVDAMDIDDGPHETDVVQDQEMDGADSHTTTKKQPIAKVATGADVSVAQKKSKALGLASQSGELRRPTKVTKGQTGPAKGSFSIRVPSQKTLGTLTSSNLHAPTAEEPATSTAAPTRPPLGKKGSSSSLRSTSTTQTSKTTATANSRLKALDAAAKTKEKEEREKQRKADEKRERERKRAHAEEEKKQQLQEKRAAEQQREREEQEARVAAQKQRAEAQRKAENMRQQAEAARAAASLPLQDPFNATSSTHQQRPDHHMARPGPRPMNDTQSAANIRPHVNPAKPKRYFQPDGEEERPATSRAAGPGPQPSGFATANNGAKRRKTSDEGMTASAPSQATNNTRPTMAPPMRPSINRKQEVPSKFTQGFMSSSTAAAAAAPQAGQSMLKTAVTTNHQMQHGPKTPHAMDSLAKFSNARIPFAEAPNPPGQQSHQQPTRPQQQKTPGTAHKSSPQYPAGDSISLPEIATDSEDSDDDNDDAFVPPAWANSPELRALLAQQQLRDPREVFGPIAPLAMEEVFKGGSKERTARFRARTSSANWGGADRLTEEERRRDREARERLEREGGWSFRADV